jgi:hypothetical protein
VGVEVRDVPAFRPTEVSSYGTIDGGFELTRLAWPKIEHRFAVRRDQEQVDGSLGTPPPRVIFGHHRFSANLLNTTPVDMLVVERGHLTQPTSSYSRESWEDLIKQTRPENRPKLVIESWPATSQSWRKGPMCKAVTTRWHDQGFASRCNLMCATRYGGAINQSRLIVVRVLMGSNLQWDWPAPEAGENVRRPMSNLLTPPGLLRVRHDPHIKLGLDPLLEAMPCRPGVWIRSKRGARRLQPDEVARGLGLPKDPDVDLSMDLIERSTSVFLWEALSESLHNLRSPAIPSADPVHSTGNPEISGDPEVPAPPPFKWKPPNLLPGSPWYQQRVANLRKAADTCSDPTSVYQQGLEALEIHRGNYDSEGPKPKQLKLLWWEFPKEHWLALREGSRMNFLRPPDANIKPNANMDAEQLAVGADFVNELLELKVLGLLDGEDDLEILLNAPLFVVPKDGQEGEWRVIADMLRGGQNMCIGNDPVILPRISHLLDLMYEGGYSAVVDASKFFYQFPTHPDDQRYLGLLHPVTKTLYAYKGLPMGAGTSPGLACRYGLAFLRALKAKYEVFQGKGEANCWWTGFTDLGFDPVKGYGFTLNSNDGPAVLIWAWVDDFLIHGPSEEKVSRGLTLFLDAALDCGLLCHPKKLTPPSQVVKYCGFLLDSREIPCLRIPVAKRERALAMVDYLLESPKPRQFSRLALSVIGGTLQSLVDATPRNLGHTKLRRFHSTIRPAGLGTGVEPYFTKATIDDRVRTGLLWWRGCLLAGKGRFARSKTSATLIPMWGDGSGTGTGGTFAVPDGPLRMWKGKWSPVVYKFSSNWKELMTLKLSLLHIKKENANSVRGTTVFYFTDNSTVYWISASGSSPSPELHKLIEEIRALELELGCTLQVIHVPGYLMIDHGDDGLSRGIWMTTLQDLTDPQVLTAAIFEPLPYDPGLVYHYLARLTQYGIPSSVTRWEYRDWTVPWNASSCFDICTVWFPPPEIARQVITFCLETWSERPLTTSFLFFVPRVVPAFWWGLSRHVHELATLYPHKTPLPRPPLVPIPVVVLYVSPHTRTLPTKDRLARVALPANAAWHKREAASVRGLSPRPIE